MTIKAKIFENGDFQANEEYVEIPTELVGGRNLFIMSEALENTVLFWANGNQNTEVGSLCSGFIPVKSNENLAFTPSTSQVFFYDKDKKWLNQGRNITSVSSVINDPSVAFMRVTYRNNFLNGGKKEDLQVKVERGTISTPFSLAPEDLGYNIPSHIQNFDNPMQFHENGIATKELVEIPKVLGSGRNLFKGYGEEEITLATYQGVGSFTQFTNRFAFDPADYVGKQFTISFYAKSPNGQTELRLYNQNGNPRYFYFSTTLDSALNTEWKYFTYTFTNNDRNQYTAIYNRIEIYAPSKTGVLVKKIKVEIGSVATPWSPAYEDLGWNIPTFVNNLSKRNLIKGSGIKKMGTTYALGVYPFGEHELVEGERYTITAKFEHGSDRNRFSLYSSAGYVALVNLTNSERDSEGVVSKTFTMKYADGRRPSDGESFKSVILYQIASTGTTSSTIDWVKIEKGTVSTPWSPAPEDLGISLPSHIHTFNNPLSINPQGISITGEFSEYPDIVEDGLVLWYDFKGVDNASTNKNTAYDLSGNDSDSTLYNFAYQGESGYISGGISLDGVDDYIRTQKALDLGSKITLEFNMRTHPEATRSQTLFSDSSQNAKAGYFWIFRTGNSLTYQYANDINFTSTSLGTVFKDEEEDIVITLVVDYDNNTVVAYKNGEYFSAGSPSPLMLLPPNRIKFIGNYSASHASRFGGTFWSLKAYNRVLSEQEILHNYNSEKGRWS